MNEIKNAYKFDILNNKDKYVLENKRNRENFTFVNLNKKIY